MPEPFNFEAIRAEAQRDLIEQREIIAQYKSKVLPILICFRNICKHGDSLSNLPMLCYSLGMFVEKGFNPDSILDSGESPDAFEAKLHDSQAVKEMHALVEQMPQELEVDFLGFILASGIAQDIAINDVGLMVGFAAGYIASRRYATRVEDLPVTTENIPESEKI